MQLVWDRVPSPSTSPSRCRSLLLGLMVVIVRLHFSSAALPPVPGHQYPSFAPSLPYCMAPYGFRRGLRECRDNIDGNW
jgi:hypothetical protein